jgi:hypothetical protein
LTLNSFNYVANRLLKIQLSESVKDKISSFYKQPNQLNEIIRKVHIVIDFIISAGPPKNPKIADYMVEVLKMKVNFEENQQVFYNGLTVVYNGLIRIYS